MPNPPALHDPDLHDTVRAEAHFKQAQRAMQAGDWKQALPLLEELHQRYPQDDVLEAILEECRFKADFDRQAVPRVRPKRSALNWRKLFSRGLMVVALLGVVLLGLLVVRTRLQPLMAESNSIEQRNQLLDDAQRAQASGALDDAERLFNELLALDPASTAAQVGLVAVAHARDLANQYSAADALFHQADYEGALQGFSDLQMAAPGYRDVNSRIQEVRRYQQLDLKYEQAHVQVQLGYRALAIDSFNEIQSLSTDYRKQEVQQALFDLNVAEAHALLEQAPPDPAQVQVALARFTDALKQRPSDLGVSVEQRLTADYLAGRDAYNSATWPQAVTKLESVYSARPSFLSNTLAPMLYQAYVNNGDIFRQNNDLYKAYDQYRLAAALPISDTVVALGRIAEIQPSLTPTPTPVPTSTPAPTAEPIPSATPTPTPTPRPMLAFQGRIVFKSENEEQPGYWVMDPNGGNREYMGPLEMYDEAINAYRETERLSPDQNYRVQVGEVDGRAQVLMAKTFDPTFPPRAITHMTRISYDPVWAPDGSQIAFVTQENESDDIWVASPDGIVQDALVRNEWEWEKHPSWSPDSTRIAFMSNREGTQAIWVMDRNGQNPRNISNVTWPEYDPIWVK